MMARRVRMGKQDAGRGAPRQSIVRRRMMTRTVIQHMMGFYLACGLTMAVLPGFVMAHDGRAVYLRRAGQVLIGFSMIMLAVYTMQPA